LERTTEPEGSALFRPQVGDVRPAEVNATAVDAQETGHAVEQRRLARAVLADEPEDLSFAELQIDLVHRGDAPEPFQDAGALEDTGASAPGLCARRARGAASPFCGAGGCRLGGAPATPTVDVIAEQFAVGPVNGTRPSMNTARPASECDVDRLLHDHDREPRRGSMDDVDQLTDAVGAGRGELSMSSNFDRG
jgi:hypothetical protein